jgi:hypothetical protein
VKWVEDAENDLSELRMWSWRKRQMAAVTILKTETWFIFNYESFY